MEKQIITTAKTVTLKDLWKIFVHRLWIIILVTAVCLGGFIAATKITYTPKYQSTATLYILRQNENAKEINVSSDFSMALNVVNDCTYLLKSHAVLDTVIDELQLSFGFDDLSKSISTSNPEKTRILEVTVKADTPEEAKRIVDAICKVGVNSISEAMGFQQVNLYEYGTLDKNPCNRIGAVTYILVGLAAAVLTYTVFLIFFLLDDRIYSNEDIEHYLGLTVLGDMPNADSINSADHYGYVSYGMKTKHSGKKGGK